MAVFHTNAIRDRFDQAGLSFAEFVRQFGEWKSAGASGEFDHPMFGKDGAYMAPRIDGKMALRHVHLQPIDDGLALSRWTKIFKRRGRKTSDRHLIYAQNGRGDFLLVAILPEPDAHNVALMKTAIHREIMEAFADVVQCWLDDGSITA